MTDYHVTAPLQRFWVRMRPFLPNSRNGKIIFGILLLLGAVLRLAALDWGVPPRENAASLYHDEGHVLGMVEAPWETFKTTFGEYEIVRPVFLWRVLGRPLIALGNQLGWNSPQTRVYEFAVLRLITALFGIAGLVGIYLLGRKIGGDAVGLWALAFLTVMPGHWYYSQILKGDLIVATFFTFLLLAAIRILERGDRLAYVSAGALLGAGTSLKPTVLIMVPILLLAHVIRSWRQRTVSAFVGPGPLLGIAAAIISFSLLYPYPFLDFSRLYTLFAEPSMQHLSVRTEVSPTTYLRMWESYNKPPRVFMEMIYGWPLRMVFLPTLLAAAVIALWQWKHRRAWGLLFLLILFALFFHSLTFTDPLDDRYILPLAPLVVLFPALLAATVLPQLHARWPLRLAGVLFGCVLFGGTAAITAATYPSFGVHDAWEETVAWVQERVRPGALVGQPVVLSRWSLSFDRPHVTLTSVIVGSEPHRHVTRLTNPEMLVVQREPWNYDHSFRYELDGVREAFQAFLQRYERVATFGREPTLFGYRLPRNRGVPVIDVYRRARDAQQTVVANFLNGNTVLRNSERSVVTFPRTVTAAELQNASVSVTLDLRDIPNAWFEEGKRVRVALFALWDDAVLPQRFSELPESSTFVTQGNVWAWVHMLRPEDVHEHTTLTITFDHPQGEMWDVYDGFDGNLQPHTVGTRQFSTARFGVMLLGSPMSLGSVRVQEAAVTRINAL